jgi:hypothetical protein
MTKSGQAGHVSNDELLARFITDRSRIRSDGTVKQDAFMPPPDLQLSVTRQINLTDDQLWRIGKRVVQIISEKRSALLYGRAEILAGYVSELNLHVEPAPLEDNPNHAHLVGWPVDKPSQKILAVQLAASARVVKYTELTVN